MIQFQGCLAFYFCSFSEFSSRKNVDAFIFSGNEIEDFRPVQNDSLFKTECQFLNVKKIKSVVKSLNENQKRMNNNEILFSKFNDIIFTCLMCTGGYA